jgi:thiamine biosynthesis lipoprotein
MTSNGLDRHSEIFHLIQFQALNTNVDLLILIEPDKIPIIERLAKDWFQNAEARFSRHSFDSELSLLNTLAGERCKISDVMLEVLSLAEKYREATGNGYNPLNVVDPSVHVSLDSDRKSILLPRQSTLDLGVIVQSWIVQRLSDFFQDRMKVKQGLLKAGSVHKVWGRSSEEFDPWLIAIEDPWQEDQDIASLAVTEEAVATYELKDDERESDIVQCTVTGEDVVECGIWAKALGKLGTKEGLSRFAQNASHNEALWITAGGDVHYYGDKSSLGTRWREIEIDYYH